MQSLIAFVKHFIRFLWYVSNIFCDGT